MRKDNLWQIKYNDIILPLSENHFKELFYDSSDKNIRLKANWTVL